MTPPDTTESDTTCLNAELETILKRIEDLTGDSLIPPDPEITRETLVDSLRETERVAIEANYSQETIDTVKLALEYIDNRYTVPPANIDDDILPEAYPAKELSRDT